LTSDASSSKYLGFTSAGATISACVKDPTQGWNERMVSETAKHMADGMQYFEELRVPTPASPPALALDRLRQLPDHDAVGLGIRLFFDNVHLRYPIVHVKLRDD
jgi:hypothetical protein